MRILIAPDKFKGSLTAGEAAAAIRAGFEQAFPLAECSELPIADGGEGTSEILCNVLGGTRVSAACRDPLGRCVEAVYARLSGDTAVIAMSAASGLWRVPAEERDPLRASTFGTGELIADAIRQGARKILLGLGGSATNDGGMGMAAALGYEFLDAAGEPLEPQPIHQSQLVHIRRRPDLSPVRLPDIVGLCDVDNPLLGPNGATRVYGPQKGTNSASQEILEAGLQRLAEVATRDLGCDHRNAPGAGAGGGLGFGMLTFCGGQLRPGFDILAETLDLAGAVARSDLIVTGEGRLDAQTLAGKGPAGVAALARAAGKPVVAFAGSIPDPVAATELFDAAVSLVDPHTPVAAAIKDAAALLRRRAAEFAARDLAAFVRRRKEP